MSHKLRKATEWIRATVDQQARIVLGPEKTEIHNENAVRRVQLIAPGSPRIFVGLSTPEDDKSPESIGYNQAPFKWPPTSGLVPTILTITAEQSLGLAAETGLAECSLIVEYLDVSAK